ncbi:alpha/beta fold hydrolase [Candidatus Nitrospira allomarina]|uniref:Alpha/beta hydrolase n=1 Tax=Candidatus Nitrospira allomarina TaxID=3020900 RepID=A0AA96JQN7_9BACT|nr:alpha/beta hydrolase [Candidatus Nitrospira allomarina]WNM56637.1 alpha/beta hydrolase [Candidatus Nitrospira allomarina]
MTWREFQRLQMVSRVNNRFVSYVEAGDGPPAILIHGIPVWGYLWHGIYSELARTRRVLIPDLLGFGFSDKADCFDRSIASQAHMITAWMTQLGIRRATIIGHDIGGGVALRMATLFPSRVEALILMNTVCYDSWPIELMLQFGHPEAHRKLSASLAVGLLRQALKRGFASSLNRRILEGMLAPYTTETGKLSLIRNAAALNTNLTTEITHLLSGIRVPTLVLWGVEDRFQPIHYGERLATDIHNSRLIRVKDARHFLMWDQPEIVTTHLLDFFDRTVPSRHLMV